MILRFVKNDIIRNILTETVTMPSALKKKKKYKNFVLNIKKLINFLINTSKQRGIRSHASWYWKNLEIAFGDHSNWHVT